MNQNQIVVGYLHVLVQSIKVQKVTQPIHAHITLGQIAKIDTNPKLSGSPVNQVFLIQVSQNPARFVFNCLQGQKKLAEFRYDIKPFMERDGLTHTIDSQLGNDEGKKIGSARIKITYYTAAHGKLSVRIFHLEFHPETIQQFKQAKVKVVCGFYVQSTQIRPLDQSFDEKVQIVVLKPTFGLNFQVIHTTGLLASYEIKNVGDVLREQPKAYQVSLFNNNKAIGLIKYQLNWIK